MVMGVLYLYVVWRPVRGRGTKKMMEEELMVAVMSMMQLIGRSLLLFS